MKNKNFKSFYFIILLLFIGTVFFKPNTTLAGDSQVSCHLSVLNEKDFGGYDTGYVLIHGTVTEHRPESDEGYSTVTITDSAGIGQGWDSGGDSAAVSYRAFFPNGNYVAYVDGYSILPNDTSSTCTRSVSFTVDVKTPSPDECSINFFNATNPTVSPGTGTRLNYSFDIVGNPSPIRIDLLQGSISPSPSTLTKTDLSSTTGNLPATHIYRLTCGSVTPREVTVTVAATAMYRWSGACSCIPDAVGGETTDPTCANIAACVPKIDCVGSWSDTSTCSKSCDDGTGGGVKQQVYTITTPANSRGDACPYLNGATRWGSTSCNTQACSAGDCIGSWSDTSTCSQTCGGGVKQQVYTITTPASGGNACPSSNGDIRWGSTSCNTQACPSGMSGTLTTPNCTITLNNGSCDTTIVWNTANPVATSAVTSTYPVTNTTVAVGNSGSKLITIPYSSRDFYLFNNSVLLDQKTATASCVSNTAWDGVKCAAPLVMSGSITPSSPSCIILEGQGSCDVSLTWSTANPSALSALVSPVNNSGSPSTNFHVSVPDANSGTVSAPVIPFNFRTFYLYNNSILLDQETATASCVASTYWDTNTKTCITSGAGGTTAPCSIAKQPIDFTASETTIFLGESVILHWNASTSCTGTNFNTGGLASGDVTVSPITDTVYRIDCGSQSAQVTVYVRRAPKFIED